MKQSFTKAQLGFIKLKFNSLKSKELFDHLVINYNLKFGYTYFRTALYDHNFYKCRMLRWTKSETQFLLDNYNSMGNIELAKKLSTKQRPFKQKQIQKKMQLLGIKRTSEGLNLILENHVLSGVYSKANFKKWETEKIPEGGKTLWNNGKNPIIAIKVNGTLKPYARHRYQQLHGQIPEGYKVYLKDCNPLNVEDENLILRKAGRLKKDENILYNKNISKILLDQKLESRPVLKEIFKEEIKTKQNFITVIINDKIRLQVKPGTNIKKLREKYQPSLQLNSF